MRGAMTMKMIRSTSTTSTSGVMLMAACILAGSPRRMARPRDLDRRHPGIRDLEQAVHELGRGPVHLDLEVLQPAGELVEGDDGRDRDEDAQRGRDQGLGDAARDRSHPAGPRRRNAAERIDDSDDRPEEADERCRGPDGGQESETLLQMDQSLGPGIPEDALDEIERT